MFFEDNSMWSPNYPCCIRCGQTSSRNASKGLCARCYHSDYRKGNEERIAKLKRKWYESFIQGTDQQRIARERQNYDGKRGIILERDGYKCVRCGSTKTLVVHHKDRTG